jgi:hypothetical protein
MMSAQQTMQVLDHSFPENSRNFKLQVVGLNLGFVHGLCGDKRQISWLAVTYSTRIPARNDS